jgi:hypothetical protein
VTTIVSVSDPTPAFFEFLELSKEARRYEAERLARDLAVAPLPDPIICAPDVPRTSPRRVHELRCMARRPRLSLREMVKEAA